MDTLYHWVGFVAVWLAILVAVVVASTLAWNRVGFRQKNALLWFRVFVLRKKWHLTRHSANVLLSAYGGRGSFLHRWERDVIAASIRYSRRVGFKPQS